MRYRSFWISLLILQISIIPLLPRTISIYFSEKFHHKFQSSVQRPPRNKTEHNSIQFPLNLWHQAKKKLFFPNCMCNFLAKQKWKWKTYKNRVCRISLLLFYCLGFLWIKKYVNSKKYDEQKAKNTILFMITFHSTENCIFCEIWYDDIELI